MTTIPLARRFGVLLGVLLLLLVARVATAATLTIDNLWPYADYTASNFVLWANGVGITSTATIAPSASFVLTLPTGLENGFTFGGAGIGGTCPGGCGWYSGVASVWAGDWIASGSIIEMFWPAIGGGWAPIARITYQGGTALRQSVPEPSTAWLLLLAGVLMTGWRWRAVRREGRWPI